MRPEPVGRAPVRITAAMRTLGIDLASQAKETAACWAIWLDGGAEVAEVGSEPLTNDVLIGLMAQADRVAIDAPFGWPLPFVEAVGAWSERGQWPTEDRALLRHRETDRAVRARGQIPLSVSSDRIAVAAMRCAHVLREFATVTGTPVDRLGGIVIEAYPAAALRSWGLAYSGYKGHKPPQVVQRKKLLDDLTEAAPWLHAPDSLYRGCEKSDHVLDSLVCALVARAVTLGLTFLPTTEQLPLARAEGWIHVPMPGTLELLPAQRGALSKRFHRG
jgi:predicted nuclease with RNAse H fold